MLTQTNKRIFLSYNRSDAVLVYALAQVLRATGVHVFRDQDNLQPGDDWRTEIVAALEQCDVVLLFWCYHSAQSAEVKKEYQQAIDLAKRVIPILLDRTALTASLSKYQAISLFGALHLTHEMIVPTLEMESELVSGMDVLGTDWGAKQERIALAKASLESGRLALATGLSTLLVGPGDA